MVITLVHSFTSPFNSLASITCQLRLLKKSEKQKHSQQMQTNSAQLTFFKLLILYFYQCIHNTLNHISQTEK